MRVAIIGAGLSGLACAHELIKNGIHPTIFEKKSHIGKDYLFSTTTLRVLDRTYKTSVKYLNQRYNLNLKSFSPLREIIMIAPQKKTVVRGKLGYIYMRGEAENSLERQLYNGLNTSILFDSYININDIKNDFDYIVAATGDETISKELGVWTTTFNVCTRVAMVLGNFKLDSTKMWVDNDYAKTCYGYLSPHSTKDARILLSIDNISCYELDHYWDKFIHKENIFHKTIEVKDIEFSIGTTSTAKVDNIYLVGNGAGVIDDFLGFGAVNALESGILAAHSIVKGIDYNDLISPIKKHVSKLHEFRKTMSRFDNKDFNRLISFLGLPPIKQLIYNNPLTKAKNFTFAAKIYNKIKEK
ncbi:UNVERIFIED_CONTAM: flavin-dependent dehydrogenase [Acetivibrio alkalicellulosi]